MYDDLDDEALDAKIIELRDKIEKVAGGGQVAVIAGEGRRREFTRSNLGELQRMLTVASNTRERRLNGGRLRGRALGVRFTR